eukprot:5170943-Pyramimonas_sp.AAC.1
MGLSRERQGNEARLLQDGALLVTRGEKGGLQGLTRRGSGTGGCVAASPTPHKNDPDKQSR